MYSFGWGTTQALLMWTWSLGAELSNPQYYSCGWISCEIYEGYTEVDPFESFGFITYMVTKFTKGLQKE